MSKVMFAKEEIKRFDAAECKVRPFRVAVSSNRNGGDYAYGSHTDVREYLDTTIGYAYSRKEALKLLMEAYEEQERRNEMYF